MGIAQLGKKLNGVFYPVDTEVEMVHLAKLDGDFGRLRG